MTDQIIDLHYTTGRSVLFHPAKEGIDGNRAHFVGNVMIDSLFAARSRTVLPVETLHQSFTDTGLIEAPGDSGVVTLDRLSNVDEPKSFVNF